MTEEEDDDDENPCRMHNAIRTMSTNVVKQQTESEEIDDIRHSVEVRFHSAT